MKFLRRLHRRVLVLALVFLPCIPGACATAAPERSATGVRQPAEEVNIVRNLNTLAVFLRDPRPGIAYSVHVHSDRNRVVPRFSDVSPHQPPGARQRIKSARDLWYPVIDFAVHDTMEAIVELAGIPDGTQGSWNGWVRRELLRIENPLRIPASQLLQWENSLWLDRSEPELRKFHVRLPLPPAETEQPVSSITLRLLTPKWSGRIEVTAREGSDKDVVIHSRRVEELPAGPSIAPLPEGADFEASRLRAALAGAVEYTLHSQVTDPRDPMHGGLYLFYDLDAGTYRTPHWVWGWGPSVGLLLEARRIPEIDALFGSARLVDVAQDIGGASLRTVPDDPSHPARGIPISRWDRGPNFDHGHEFAITPCDAAFLAKWAWLPLAHSTGDRKWLDASVTLADALGRLMNEFTIPPQNYWPDYGRWDEKTIDEAGFGAEIFDGLYQMTGDDRMRTLGRRYIEQHLAALGRPDGLWDRAHFRDGRPNTPTLRMTRGLGWPMEGLLAAHRLLPDEKRYLSLASQMAGHLLAAQTPEGWWVHRFDQPVEEWGVGTKGTALWSWLFYELHRHSGDPRHLSAARRALGWLLDEQYFGPDFHARGGHVTVSPHSAVGYRHWFRVTCTYGAAFFGLALLEELKLQESSNERE